MGEKYDGMRCCWNPDEEKLYYHVLMSSFLIDHFIVGIPAEEFQ